MLAEFASTSRIFAAGAIACAHSTSSEISPAQLESVLGRPPPPDWLTTFRSAAGRLNVLLKVARSAAMFGSL